MVVRYFEWYNLRPPAPSAHQNPLTRGRILYVSIWQFGIEITIERCKMQQIFVKSSLSILNDNKFDVTMFICKQDCAHNYVRAFLHLIDVSV